jgi:hypothetical protein
VSARPEPTLDPQVAAARARLEQAVDATRAELDGGLSLVARGFRLRRAVAPLIAAGVGLVLALRVRHRFARPRLPGGRNAAVRGAPRQR